MYCKYGGLELPSCGVVINPPVTQQIGCWTFEVVREMWLQITHEEATVVMLIRLIISHFKQLSYRVVVAGIIFFFDIV